MLLYEKVKHSFVQYIHCHKIMFRENNMLAKFMLMDIVHSIPYSVHYSLVSIAVCSRVRCLHHTREQAAKETKHSSAALSLR
jgi:dolichyl-phosphate-mannose--protein O-mannosyl transferase